MTIRGDLDRMNKDLQGSGWIQVKTLLPGGAAIRTHVLVGDQTLIARGVERVDLSSLRKGDFIEVTYHRGQSGFMEAETLYVCSDEVSVANKSRQDHADHSGETYGGGKHEPMRKRSKKKSTTEKTTNSSAKRT